jgi:hypothetical protein
MSLHVSPQLYQALAEAARLSGKALSAEATFQLERVMEREAQVDRTLDALFGSQAGALMELLAFLARGQGDWLNDAQAYADMRLRITTLLDAVAPPGAAQGNLSAETQVELLLGRLFRSNPDAIWFRWATALHGRLGSDVTRRIMLWLAGRQA